VVTSANPALDYVTLIVTDGGAPYVVHSPFRLTAAGWLRSGKGTPLAVTPLQWKPYVPRPKRRLPPAALHPPHAWGCDTG
jgi:hypothetical protein